VISTRATETGFEFYLAELEDMSFDSWPGRIGDLDQPEYSVIRQLVENGRADVRGGVVVAEPDNLYEGETDEGRSDSEIEDLSFRLLGFPPFYPYALYVSGSGLLHEKSFRYRVRFCEKASGFGPSVVLELSRLHCLLTGTNGEWTYSLPFGQFQLLVKIDAFNALPDRARTYQRTLDEFAQIRTLAQECDAVLGDQLANERVERPTGIGLDVREASDGTIEIRPDISGPGVSDDVRDGFKKSFSRRINVDEVYNVEGANGSRCRVPVDPRQQKTLNVIKRRLSRIADPETIRQIVERPAELFDPEECDIDFDLEEFSRRVVEIGAYRPRVYPFITPIRSEWFPGIYLEDPINGDTRIPFRTQEELDAFVAAFNDAKASGADSFKYEDVDIGVADAEQVISVAEKQFADRTSPVSDPAQKVLLIKENAEVLEYVEEHETGEVRHLFHTVPGLSQDIELKEYQQEGIAWMQSLMSEGLHGCLLADDMGLGKTLQVLCFAEWLAHDRDECRILVVSPLSVVENWKDEYARFFPNGILETYASTEADQVVRSLPESLDGGGAKLCLIIGYESLRTYQLRLGRVDWTLLVLDEAQRIKTPGRIVTNAAKAMKTQFRVAATGTPVENSFHDYWSIMDFSVPGLLGDARSFGKEFAVKRTTPYEEIDRVGRRLRERSGPFLKRRLKRDVLSDLPPKHQSDREEDREIFARFGLQRNMPDEQLREYKRVVARARQDSELSQSRSGILTAIQRLKWVSDHPHLYSENLLEQTTDQIVGQSARMIALVEILDHVKSAKEKAIVFAEFKMTQRMIAHVIQQKYGLNVSIINGDTPALARRGKESRQSAIRQFNSSEGFNVIVMSPIAAGVGLNVTGANHVVHYGRHWNPAKEDQATDRAYRIGQAKTVYVYHPMAIAEEFETFDVILGALLSSKRHFASATLFPSEMAEVEPADLLQRTLHLKE